MMLKVSIFVEVGNRAIEDGSLARAMQSTNECLKAETAYVLIGEGGRPLSPDPLRAAIERHLDG